MFVSYLILTTSPVRLISNALSHVREELATVEHRTASFTSERVRSCLPEASQFVESCQTLILTTVPNHSSQRSAPQGTYHETLAVSGDVLTDPNRP